MRLGIKTLLLKKKNQMGLVLDFWLTFNVTSSPDNNGPFTSEPSMVLLSFCESVF